MYTILLAALQMCICCFVIKCAHRVGSGVYTLQNKSIYEFGSTSQMHSVNYDK